jgi:hypothetical protein
LGTAWIGEHLDVVLLREPAGAGVVPAVAEVDDVRDGVGHAAGEAEELQVDDSAAVLRARGLLPVGVVAVGGGRGAVLVDRRRHRTEAVEREVVRVRALDRQRLVLWDCWQQSASGASLPSRCHSAS